VPVVAPEEITQLLQVAVAVTRQEDTQISRQVMHSPSSWVKVGDDRPVLTSIFSLMTR
jgi:hypothetical protein